MTRPDIAVRTVCLDCDDAHAMAGFYGALLGWEPTFTEPDWVLMRNPEGGIGLSFQAEPSYRAPTWPEQGEFLGDHATQGVAEQVDPIDP